MSSYHSTQLACLLQQPAHSLCSAFMPHHFQTCTNDNIHHAVGMPPCHQIVVPRMPRPVDAPCHCSIEFAVLVFWIFMRRGLRQTFALLHLRFSFYHSASVFCSPPPSSHSFDKTRFCKQHIEIVPLLIVLSSKLVCY